MPNISASAALERLKSGNHLFATDQRGARSPVQDRRSELLAGQNPFAVILGCADSRVPVEMVFNQGLGDLFVVRVAGNIVAPAQLGSIEFAVASWDVPLVVVLGHSRCGAVDATIKSIDNPGSRDSPALQSIVDAIRPAVEATLASGKAPGDGDLLQHAGRANVQASVDQLCRESDTLQRRIATGDLRVIGAEYSLETGQVAFFE